ncbi:MAG: metallophosphoesterase [Deltaproteobacteria bacterium]|nr:metallophosphoesterase [Deltaproteobacteria bacterium]
MRFNYAFIMFIGVFLSLYALLHLYFYRKVTKAFHLTLSQNIIFIIILFLLLLSPIIMRLIEGKGPEALSTAVTYAGYLWMGIIFLLFALNLAVDIYRFFIYLSSHIFNINLLKLMPDRRVALICVILVTAFINLYGVYEAWDIRAEMVTLETTKLPANVERLRVVQISDIHFSRINGIRLAEKITGMISGLNPDLLVSTGDLIDDGLKEQDKVKRLFRDINSKYGKYAATGNHEFFAGIQITGKFTEDCGFRLLRNESISVNDFINIAGIDDPAVNRGGFVHKIDEAGVIKGFSPDKINIFLKHQPRIEKESINKFDLQLSGHTHRGQIFPFSIFVGMMFKHMDGLYNLGSNSYLYVSSGTGTWGPPIRFLAPPEITVIDFVHEQPRQIN